MLDRGRYGVPRAGGPGQRAPHPGVDGFGSRRSEDDLARSGAEERGNLFASVFERDARGTSFGVEPTGVGVMLAEIGEHRVERGRT
jgi:hypothetical protein